MSKVTTKSGRGGAPRTPKDKVTVSTIKQYMSQGASPKNIDLEKQGPGKVDKKKRTERKQEKHQTNLETI